MGYWILVWDTEKVKRNFCRKARSDECNIRRTQRKASAHVQVAGRCWMVGKGSIEEDAQNFGIRIRTLDVGLS